MADATFEIRLAANAQELIKNLRAAQEAWAAFAGRLQETQGALWNTTVLGFQLSVGGKVLTTALGRAAQTADQFRIRLIALEQAAFNTGISFAEVSQAINQLSRELAVAPEQIAGAFSMLLRRGYELDQVTELIRRFADAAVNIGKPIDEGILKGAQAVAQELSRLLNEIGIPENVSDSIRDMASNLGVSVNALTDSQRRAAIFNMVMQSTSDKVGLANVALGGFIGALQRLRLEWATFNRDFGAGVSSAFIPIVEGVRLALSALNALPEGFRKALGFASGLAAILTSVAGLTFLAVSNTQRLLATVSGTLSAAISSVREFVDVFRNTRLAIEDARRALIAFAASGATLDALSAKFAVLRRQIATLEAIRPIADRASVATFLPPVDIRQLIKKTKVPVASLGFDRAQEIDNFIAKLTLLSRVAQGPVKQALSALESEVAQVASSVGIAAAGFAGFGEAVKMALSGKLERGDAARVLSAFDKLKQTLTDIQKNVLPATFAAFSLREASGMVQKLNALNATIAKVGLSLDSLPKPSAEAAEAMKALGLSLENPIVGFNRLVNLVSSGALSDPLLAKQAQVAAKYYASLARQLDAIKASKFGEALVDDALFERFKESRRQAIELIEEIQGRLSTLDTLAGAAAAEIPGAVRARLAGLQVVARELDELVVRISEAIRRGAPPKELLGLWNAYALTVTKVVDDVERKLASRGRGEGEAAQFLRDQIDDLRLLLRDAQRSIGEAAQAFGAAILPFPETEAQRRALRRFVDQYTAAVAAIVPTLNARIKGAIGQLDITDLPAEMTRKALVDMRQAVVDAVKALSLVVPSATLIKAEKLLPIDVNDLERSIRRVFSPAGVKASLIFTESFREELAQGKRLFEPDVILGSLVGLELLARRLDGTTERVVVDLREIAQEAKVAPERAAAALTNLFAYVDKAADRLVLAQSRALYGMNTISSVFVSGLSRILNFVGLKELAKRLEEAFNSDLLVLYAAQARATEGAARAAFRGIAAELALLVAQAKNAATALLFAGGAGAAGRGGIFSGLVGGISGAVVAISTGISRLGALISKLSRLLISGLGQSLVIVSTLAKTVGGAIVGLGILIASSPLFRSAFFNALAGAVALLTGTFKGLFNLVAAGVAFIRNLTASVVESVPGIDLLAAALNRLKAGLLGLGDLLKIAGTEFELLGKKARLAVLKSIPEGRRSLSDELGIRLLERDIGRLAARTESLFTKLERMWRSFTLPRNVFIEKELIAQFDALRSAVDAVEVGIQRGTIGVRQAESSYDALSGRVKELSERVLELQEKYKIPGAQNFIAALKAIQGEIDRGRERLAPFIEELRRFEDELAQLRLRVQIEGAPEARREIAQLSLDLEKALQAVERSGLTPADKAAVAQEYRGLFAQLNAIAQEEFVYGFTRLMRQGQAEITRTLTELILAPMARIRREMELEIERINMEFDDLVRRYGRDTPEGFQLEAQRRQQIEAVRKVYLQRLRDQAQEEARILRELRIAIARELNSLREEYIGTYESITNALRRASEIATQIDLSALNVLQRRDISLGKLFPEEADVRRARLELERTLKTLEEYANRIRAVFGMRREALFSEWQVALDEAYNEVIVRLRDIERQISDPDQLAQVRVEIVEAYNKKIESIQRNYNARLVALENELNTELLSIAQQRVQAQSALMEASLASQEASYRRRVESITALAQDVLRLGDLTETFRSLTPSIGPLVEAMRLLRNEALALGRSSNVPIEALRTIRQEADRLAETLINRLVDAIKAARDAVWSLRDSIRGAFIQLSRQSGDVVGATLASIKEADLPAEAIKELTNAVQEASTAVTGLGQAYDNALRQARLEEIGEQVDVVLNLANAYGAAKEEVQALEDNLRSLGLANIQEIERAAQKAEVYLARLNELKGKYEEAQRAFASAPDDAKLKKWLEDLQNEISRTEASLAKAGAAREYLRLRGELSGLSGELARLAKNVKEPSRELVILNADLRLTALETQYLKQQVEILNSTLGDNEKKLRLAQLAVEYYAQRVEILNARNQELIRLNAVLPEHEREAAEAALQHAQAREELTQAATAQTESLYSLVRAMNELKRAELDYAEAQEEIAAIMARLERSSVDAARAELKLADLRAENAARRLELARLEYEAAASDEERASALRELAGAEKALAQAMLERQEALLRLWGAEDAARARTERLAYLFLRAFGVQIPDAVYEAVRAIDNINALLERAAQVQGEAAERILDQLIDNIERAIELYSRLALQLVDTVRGVGRITAQRLKLRGVDETAADLKALSHETQRLFAFLGSINLDLLDTASAEELGRRLEDMIGGAKELLLEVFGGISDVLALLDLSPLEHMKVLLESGVYSVKELNAFWEKYNQALERTNGLLYGVREAYLDLAERASAFLLELNEVSFDSARGYLSSLAQSVDRAAYRFELVVRRINAQIRGTQEWMGLLSSIDIAQSPEGLQAVMQAYERLHRLEQERLGAQLELARAYADYAKQAERLAQNLRSQVSSLSDLVSRIDKVIGPKGGGRRLIDQLYDEITGVLNQVGVLYGGLSDELVNLLAEKVRAFLDAVGDNVGLLDTFMRFTLERARRVLSDAAQQRGNLAKDVTDLAGSLRRAAGSIAEGVRFEADWQAVSARLPVTLKTLSSQLEELNKAFAELNGRVTDLAGALSSLYSRLEGGYESQSARGLDALLRLGDVLEGALSSLVLQSNVVDWDVLAEAVRLALKSGEGIEEILKRLPELLSKSLNAYMGDTFKSLFLSSILPRLESVVGDIFGAVSGMREVGAPTALMAEDIKRAIVDAVSTSMVARPNVVLDVKINNNVNIENLARDLYDRISKEILRELKNRNMIP